jgi:hypothetical protein
MKGVIKRMDEQFVFKLMTQLETKGIKADYNKIKQMLENDPTKINTILDMSATKTEMNKFISEYAPKFQKMFQEMFKGKNINVDLKDVEASMRNVFSQTEKAAQKSADVVNKAYADLRKETYQSIGQKPQALKDLSNYYTDLEKQITSQNKLNDSMQIVSTRAKTASVNFDTYKKSLKSSALKEYSDQIQEISNSLSKAQSTGNRVDLSKATSSVNEFKASMKNAGYETNSFNSILQQNISAFTQWYLIGGAVSSVIGKFKSAMGTIIETDTLLTEISKTSDLTGESLSNLGISAYDSASKFGTTVQSYLQG